MCPDDSVVVTPIPGDPKVVSILQTLAFSTEAVEKVVVVLMRKALTPTNATKTTMWRAS
jgi:hypothetical protein